MPTDDDDVYLALNVVGPRTAQTINDEKSRPGHPDVLVIQRKVLHSCCDTGILLHALHLSHKEGRISTLATSWPCQVDAT